MAAGRTNGDCNAVHVNVSMANVILVFMALVPVAVILDGAAQLVTFVTTDTNPKAFAILVKQDSRVINVNFVQLDTLEKIATSAILAGSPGNILLNCSQTQLLPTMADICATNVQIIIGDTTANHVPLVTMCPK